MIDSAKLAHIAHLLGKPSLFLGPALPECHKATLRAHLIANDLGESAVGDLELAPAGTRWSEYFENEFGEPLGDAP